MNDFEMFVRSLGLVPRSIAPDGRIRTCPTERQPGKRNGRYFLAVDGIFGWAQDWSQHESPVIWRAEQATEVPVLDYQRIRQQNEARETERAEASRRAREFYAECSPLIGGHPYLEAHGLDMTGCRGLKVDRDGWLVVPMVRGREIQSVQRIAPDGAKLFWAGASTSGVHYPIIRERSTVTVLCEGLATGLAVFAAVPQARVVVAFTSGNLPKIARELPRRGLTSVASDNDHRTVCPMHKARGVTVPHAPPETRPEGCRCNPGRIAGLDAAQILACDYAFPECEGTDWCDFRQERLAAVLSRPLYGARMPAETNARRAVDAEIARAILSAARFVSATG